MLNKKGFTLVELLIACGIALVILITVGFMYVSSDRSFRFGRDVISSEADLRLAMDWLIRDIREAETIEISGNTVKLDLPSSISSDNIVYTLSDAQLTRTHGSSTKVIVTDITDFNVATNDAVGISLSSLKPRLNKERTLTSKVTMRNAK